MPAAPLRWGIIGLGAIAGKFANGLRGARRGRLAAVASRHAGKARAFAAEHGAERAYGSYPELLADEEIDAVYIATPHPLHPAWCIAACAAGKHVLCEKPLALNRGQAAAMIRAAQDNDVFLMEAFLYRCHPQTARLLALLRDGAIGTPLLVRAAFSFASDAGPETRVRAPELGGGGILDVGCYPISFARLIAGAAEGRAFAEPEALEALGVLGETGVDEQASAVLRFPNGMLAECSTGIRVQQGNEAWIYGSAGRLHLAWPWNPDRGGEAATLTLWRAGAEPVVERVRAAVNIYGNEADHVAEQIAQRQSPLMSWDDSLGNMAALDRWRAAIGLRYPGEDERVDD